MKFSIKEAFKSAFRVFRQNFFVVFSLSVFVSIVAPVFLFLIWYFVIKNLFAFTTPVEVAISNIINASNFFAVILFTSAFLPAFIESKIKFRNCFPNLKKLFNYLLGTILMLIPLIPFFVFNQILVKTLVSVAGLVILFRYYVFFAQEALGGNSVLQSFRNSAKLTSGNLCKLFLLILLLGLTILPLMILAIAILLITSLAVSQNSISALIALIAFSIAIIMFFVALLIMLPFTMLVLMHVYTQLSLKSNLPLKKAESETDGSD